MTLSEELTWRGFVNQTTLKDSSRLDGDPITFYWGVDPSADSMQVGNLAMAMMVKHFVAHGHHAVLLIGGATGLIGDPDGKASERDLKSYEQVDINKKAIAAQYQNLFNGQDFQIVDNYDWFKDFNYLQFLRDVGKHIPMRQMLAREFVQTRLGANGEGISYAEFSYVLIQAYDFLHMHRELGVDFQVCGSDQWGNSIAGVDLIRRVTGDETHVWSAPLVINKSTGIKFGKSEAGAIWLDPKKTSPTQFYQFWINVDDEGVEDYIKIYTVLDKQTVDELMVAHREDRAKRLAQTRLAREITTLVHGEATMLFAERVTEYLVGATDIAHADDAALAELRHNLPIAQATANGSLLEALVASGLASSNNEARRLIAGNAVALNGKKVSRDHFVATDFTNGRLLLRRGKAFKDSALVELA
jgi:tyrosyl-tRNA synthetase